MKREVKIENLYIIGWGLGGSFGGIQNYEVIEADSLEEAEKEAYYSACEEYEMYSNHFTQIDEIMNEEGVDEQEAVEIYEEERESWLEYSAQPYSKELEKKAEIRHYQNDYKHITSKL